MITTADVAEYHKLGDELSKCKRDFNLAWIALFIFCGLAPFADFDARWSWPIMAALLAFITWSKTEMECIRLQMHSWRESEELRRHIRALEETLSAQK